jgi:hypothetical protein
MPNREFEQGRRDDGGQRFRGRDERDFIAEQGRFAGGTQEQPSYYHPQGGWHGAEEWQRFGRGDERWGRDLGRGDERWGRDLYDERFGRSPGREWSPYENRYGGYGMGGYGEPGWQSYGPGYAQPYGRGQWDEQQRFGQGGYYGPYGPEGRWGHEGRSSFEARRGFEGRFGQQRMGRAPRSYQRSDERIKDDLCDAILRSWIDAENVEIQVKQGEITLGGTVEDRQQKRAIEDLAEQILGVKDVHNQIRIQHEERTSSTVGTKKPVA